MIAPEWKLRDFDPPRVQALARASNLHPLVAQLLLLRGVHDASAAQAFLEVRRDGLHDPETLPGAAEAADRLVRAVRQGRKIVIYGDYDVDGVCGTSLLWACLRLAGARDVDYYIPHRIDEGYGVNADALRRLAAETKAEVVVTVDCGVSACAEARLARELGLEFIITDHHTPGPHWPEADVVVHPRAPGSTYPFGDLCGAAVAFKLAWQVCKSFGDGKKASPHLRDFLVQAMNYVALATVADVVPLEGENRIFVRHGLAGMARSPSVGLRALMEVSGCLSKSKLNTGNLGFGLAPRVNAAGRMERAMMAVELLTTNDSVRAAEIAQLLNDCNTRRQEIERQIVRAAHAQLDENGGLGERGAIVLASRDWHPGVIGIVASRLVDAYHRPAVVIALGDELGQGSARSVPGFDLYAALACCADGLVSFGGHTAAAGLKLKADRVAAFAEQFDSHCRTSLAPELRKRTLWIDAETRLSVLTRGVVEQFESLEPYGIGNVRPLLLAQPVRMVGEPRTVGNDGAHLQLRLNQGAATLRAVAWNAASRFKGLDNGTAYAVVFHPQINEWQDRREVQLEIRDLRPVSDQTPVVAAAGVE